MPTPSAHFFTDSVLPDNGIGGKKTTDSKTDLGELIRV